MTITTNFRICKNNSDMIQCAESCPFDSAQQLVAISTKHQLMILDTSDLQNMQTIATFPLTSAGSVLSWSPISSMTEYEIAVGCQDSSIMVYKSNKQTPECITTSLMPSLRDPIQSLVFDSSQGHYLCCCSDDKYLRVWNFQESDPQEQVFSLKLESRGVACVFHPGLTEHVLVAEESGCIRFLNIANREWIFTTMHPQMGDLYMNLLDADWNLEDPNVFGALIGDKWMVWNMSCTPLHLPRVQGDAHLPGPRHFRWSRKNPKMFAIASGIPVGKESNSIRIYESIQRKVPMSLHVNEGIQNISWQNGRNCLIAAGTKCLYFWSL